MKIYTSYFAQAKKLTNLGIRPIGIARWAPRWAAGITSYKHLAPTPDMLKDATCPTYRQYVEMFDKILDNLDPENVLKDLEALSGGDDIALLCYEKVGDFCHRHLVAKWLSDRLGIEVVEWNNEDQDMYSACMAFVEPAA
jgi:uncharacterized protein YeaO (DUF488 family)